MATPDDTILINQTPKVASAPTTPPTKTPTGADMGTLPDEVILLQGEMNRAIGCLLTTRVSIDAHCRKQVSDFKTVFHQNKAETTKAIRGVKAHYGAAIREGEACCTTTIREVEACHATTIRGGGPQLHSH